MATKLGTLVVILLLSLTAFSQKDTSRIQLKNNVARLVVVDLLKGDSLFTELQQTKNKLDFLTLKVELKDKLINSYQQKVKLYDEEIKACNEKEVNYQDLINKLETSNKKLKKTVNILGVTLTVSAAVIATTFLLK